MKHRKIWNALTGLKQTQLKQEAQIMRMTTVNLRLRVSDLETRTKYLQRQVNEMWGMLMPPGDKPSVPDIEAAQAAHDKSELDRLVDYIRSKHPGGIAMLDESVTDTAIRLLKTYRLALISIERERVAPDLNEFSETAELIARGALGASLEQSDDAV